MRRKSRNLCALEVDYTEGGISIPLERCDICGKERAMACYVVRSLERPNPFSRPPVYDCICGKGNEAHRVEWQAQTDSAIAKLRKMIGAHDV